MRMLYQLQALTPRQVEALLADPDLAEEIAFTEAGEQNEAIFGEPLAARLGLDQAWDILRVLLAGMESESADPSPNALLGGEAMGEDVGYGPARLRTAAETEQLARFLRSVELDQLLSRVNYAEMAMREIHHFPQTEDALREEISANYPMLRDYVSRAADAKQGLLVWLC
jgi:hypothetical protein